VWPRRAGREIGGREGACRSSAGASREGCGEIGAGWGVEPEGVVVLTGVAALGAEAAVRTCGWDSTVSRTGTKEQDARARAREARLTLLADRNAQDERIEAAVAAALLGWEDRTAAAGKVEEGRGRGHSGRARAVEPGEGFGTGHGDPDRHRGVGLFAAAEDARR